MSGPTLKEPGLRTDWACFDGDATIAQNSRRLCLAAVAGQDRLDALKRLSDHAQQPLFVSPICRLAQMRELADQPVDCHGDPWIVRMQGSHLNQLSADIE
jgi:hypothetical protein